MAGGFPGQARMLAAARIIAEDARVRAAAWSVQIPATLRVTAGETTARVSSGVGPSYPNEVLGVRHPVFGHRSTWVTNDYRPFLAPAAEAKADEAAAEIAKGVDDFCRSLGFEGTG